jgi:hypothetical protein
MSANLVFGELLKLPILIQHYHFHQGKWRCEDQDISLWDFLKKHYSSDTNSADCNHNNLPFKSVDLRSVSTVTLLPIAYQPHLFTITENKEPQKFLFVQIVCAYNYLASIWRPPCFS